MMNIDKVKWKYIKESLCYVVALTVLILLAKQIWSLADILTPMFVGFSFAIVVEGADVMIWSKIAKRDIESLPTFFMGVSIFRMLAAIGVLFIYFLLSKRDSFLTPILIFMAYYFVILIHHSLFFTVKNKEKEVISNAISNKNE